MVLLHLKEVSLCFVKKVTTSSRCHGMAPIIKHLKYLAFNIIFFFLKCMLCVFLSSVRRDVSFYLINFYLRLFLVIIHTFTLRFCFCCGGPLCVISTTRYYTIYTVHIGLSMSQLVFKYKYKTKHKRRRQQTQQSTISNS
jgi:hypothetical protein